MEKKGVLKGLRVLSTSKAASYRADSMNCPLPHFFRTMRAETMLWQAITAAKLEARGRASKRMKRLRVAKSIPEYSPASAPTIPSQPGRARRSESYREKPGREQ